MDQQQSRCVSFCSITKDARHIREAGSVFWPENDMFDQLISGKSLNLSNKKCYIILLWVFLLAFLINTLTLRADQDWGGDFSLYIAQAKSLVDGTIDQLIENSTLRYKISDDKLLGPLLYPWGFPILLAPVYYFFGFNIFVIKLFINLFFFLALATSYLIFKNKINNIQNVLIIAIIAFNPYFFDFKERILSDIPFLFFTLFSIFLIQQFAVKKRHFFNEFTSYSLIGIFLFISCSIRSNGIILLPTLFLIQIIANKYSTEDSGRKCPRYLKYSTPYLVFFFLVFIINMLLPNNSNYSNSLTLITFRGILGNSFFYATLLYKFFTNIIPKSGIIIYLITLPFVILGLLEKLNQDYPYLIFSICLVGLFIVWPDTQGLRFILPIIPFYLYFLFVGLSKMESLLTNSNMKTDVSFRKWLRGTFEIIHLKKIIAAFRPPFRIEYQNNAPKTDEGSFNVYGTSKYSLVLIIGLLLVFISFLTVSISIYKQNNAKYTAIPGPYHEDSIQLFNYISHNTNKESIIVFRKPRVMTLYTNRKSVATVNIDNIIESGAEYIVYDQNSQLELVIERFGQRIEEVFANNTFKLYQLNAEK